MKPQQKQKLTTISDGPRSAAGSASATASASRGRAVVYMPANDEGGGRQLESMTVSPGLVTNYAHRQSKCLGAVLIVVGALSIALTATDWSACFKLRVDSDEMLVDRIRFFRHGVVAGILTIIAGGFGIGAARNKTKCQIRAFMVLNIVAACFYLFELTAGILAALTVNESPVYTACSADGNVINEQNWGIIPKIPTDTECFQVHLLFMLEVMLAVVSFVAGAVALWGSALGCKAACCCGCKQYEIVHYYIPLNHEQDEHPGGVSNCAYTDLPPA